MSRNVSTACLLLSVLLSAPHTAVADAVTTWNATAGAAAVAACISPVELTNPLHESRLYAIAHVAHSSRSHTRHAAGRREAVPEVQRASWPLITRE
jgi:hypothetical protein